MLFDCNTVSGKRVLHPANNSSVYVKFKGRVQADGTIIDEKGNVIGKSDDDGVIRDSAGQVIGKRDKSLNELRAAYSLPGL